MECREQEKIEFYFFTASKNKKLVTQRKNKEDNKDLMIYEKYIPKLL